jgi:hypothetical protein
MVKKIISVDGIVLMIKGEPATFIFHLLKINPEKWGLLWNLAIIYGVIFVNQQISMWFYILISVFVVLGLWSWLFIMVTLFKRIIRQLKERKDV